MLSYTEHGKFRAPIQAPDLSRRGDYAPIPRANWIMAGLEAQWLQGVKRGKRRI
jgi:hypothetical protein